MTVLREGVVGGALNVFFIYKFLRILTQPFNETDAFKLGIIDENGKILKKHKKLKTQEEKDSYTLMHRLVWKLKRLMEKIPFGKSRLASYAAALWLIKEEKTFDGTDEELQESFLAFLETDWEDEARIIKEIYEADPDKKSFSNLREDHMKPDKKGHKLPPHLAKFFDKKGNLKKDAADRIRKGRKERGVKITDRTPDWMFKEVAPPGWEGTVKAMKKKKEIDNPYALAWHMHNKGMKPHIPEEFMGENMLDEAKKKDIGMECQECGKKFRAKLSSLEYGKTKCPKCKSTDIDFQFGENVDEKHGGFHWKKGMKIKPKKVKKMKDLRLYGKSPSKKKSSSSAPHVPAFGISRKGGFGAGKGYGKHGGGPLMMGEEEINEKEAAYPPTVDNLKKIVKDKQNQIFMFKDGKARVDLFSASALMGVYNALKPATKKKFETMIKTKGGFMKSVDFAMKMAKEEVEIDEAKGPRDNAELMALGNKLRNEKDKKKKQELIKKIESLKDVTKVIRMKILRDFGEEVAPHAKVMAKKGDSPEKIKDMHPEITDDELEKLFKEEFNITTVTTFKSFLSEGRPALDPDYVPPRTQTDAMRAKLLSTQKKLYSARDIQSMANKYKQKLVGDPVGGKSWGGDWQIELRNGIHLDYQYGPNSTYIKGWKFDRNAIKNYIGKYANEHETPRDYAPMGGKVLVGGLEAAFEVISEHCGHCEMGIEEEFWAVIDTAKKDEVMAVSSDEKGARDSVKSSTISKRDYHYGKDPKTLKVVKVKGKYSQKKVERMIGEPLKEEAPANSVAGGNIEFGPFVKKKRKNAKVQTEMFGGQKVFVVSPERFFDSRLGKSRYARYEKYVGNDKLGEAIRQYGRNNPQNSIILKNSGNGAMLYLKYGNKK